MDESDHGQASHVQPGLFLQEGQVDVHVRGGDGRPDVQQRADRQGDDGLHRVQVEPGRGHDQLGDRALDTHLPWLLFSGGAPRL